MIQFFINVFFFILMSSCSSQGGTFPVTTNFKKTLSMVVNGTAGKGVLVVNKAPVYEIDIKLDDRAELIKLTTCHREIIVERGSFKSKISHKVSFRIQAGIENEGFCTINIGAFDLQGQHAWGLVEIKNETLPATQFCNGEARRWDGVSICQARKGLIQRIQFDQPVNYSMIGNCGEVGETGKKSFDIELASGQCIMIFHSDGKYHRATLFGYDDILLQSPSVDRQHPNDQRPTDPFLGGS